MRFDWTDLQLFLHACDAGSLTGAAQRAHLTLAAVSARIRAMEDSSGTALLERHSRGVRPTAAGETLASHARAVLDRLAQLRAEMAQHSAATGGTVRLLANTSGLARLRSGSLAGFLRRHPAGSLAIEESTSHLTTQALRQGLADVGIVSDASDVEGLQVHELGDDPMLLVMPPGHPLAGRRAPTFSRALDEPWVGCGATSALQMHLALQAARLGKAMKLRADVAHLATVRAMVSQGVGLTVMPATMLEQPGDAPAVATAALGEPWARRKLLLCAAAPETQKPLVRALFEALAA
jgi:DNA-binding transcriptional LysR family regulator